jgi:hypothetical protein
MHTLIPEFGRLKKEDYEFEITLCYIGCLPDLRSSPAANARAHTHTHTHTKHTLSLSLKTKTKQTKTTLI